MLSNNNQRQDGSERGFGDPALALRLTGMLLLTLVTLTGCGKSDTATAAAATPTTEIAKEKRHPLTGEIVSIETERNVLVVRHDVIPGVMPAMTMEFQVSAGDVAAVKKGQRIRAQLV